MQKLATIFCFLVLTIQRYVEFCIDLVIGTEKDTGRTLQSEKWTTPDSYFFSLKRDF